jgi:hypothetical protein
LKGEILKFLKRERDALAEEIRRLQQGERKVVHLNAGEHDITAQHADELEQRWLRFEELIAACESGVA